MGLEQDFDRHLNSADIVLSDTLEPVNPASSDSINLEDDRWPCIPVGQVPRFIDEENVSMRSESKEECNVLYIFYKAENEVDEIGMIINNYIDTGETNLMAYKQVADNENATKDLRQFFNQKIDYLVNKSEDYYSDNFGIEF